MRFVLGTVARIYILPVCSTELSGLTRLPNYKSMRVAYARANVVRSIFSRFFFSFVLNDYQLSLIQQDGTERTKYIRAHRRIHSKGGNIRREKQNGRVRRTYVQRGRREEWAVYDNYARALLCSWFECARTFRSKPAPRVRAVRIMKTLPDAQTVCYIRVHTAAFCWREKPNSVVISLGTRSIQRPTPTRFETAGRRSFVRSSLAFVRLHTRWSEVLQTVYRERGSTRDLRSWSRGVTKGTTMGAHSNTPPP